MMQFIKNFTLVSLLISTSLIFAQNSHKTLDKTIFNYTIYNLQKTDIDDSSIINNSILFTKDSDMSESEPSLYIIKFNLINFYDLSTTSPKMGYNNFENLKQISKKLAIRGYKVATTGIKTDTSYNNHLVDRQSYYIVLYFFKEASLNLALQKKEIHNTENIDKNKENKTIENSHDTIKPETKVTEFNSRQEKIKIYPGNDSITSINLNIFNNNLESNSYASEKLRRAFEEGLIINFVEKDKMYIPINSIYSEKVLLNSEENIKIVISNPRKDNKLNNGLVDFIANNNYDMNSFSNFMENIQEYLLGTFSKYFYE